MMRRLLSHLRVLLVLILAAPGFVGSAGADQKDPRLLALFGQLKAAPTSEAAAAIERQIWDLWVEAGDPETDKSMMTGAAAMAARDFPAALDAFNRVIARRPDFAEGWNRRATLYYLMGEYQKSLDDIDRTLALEPRHFGALSGLGLVNLQLDRKEAAASAWQRVLDVDPQNEGARENLDALNAVLKRESI
jgi:tetratricopeptide (TPR) repeat protein